MALSAQIFTFRRLTAATRSFRVPAQVRVPGGCGSRRRLPCYAPASSSTAGRRDASSPFLRTCSTSSMAGGIITSSGELKFKFGSIMLDWPRGLETTREQAKWRYLEQR